MAEQSSTTKGLERRCEWLWTACAISSLPVPVSPWTRTVSSEGAEDLAHLHRLPDDPVEAVLLGERDLHHLVERLELELGVADAEDGAGLEEDLADPEIAVVDAVGRIQVAEDMPTIAGGDLEVAAGDRLVGQDQVVDDRAAAAD